MTDHLKKIRQVRAKLVRRQRSVVAARTELIRLVGEAVVAGISQAKIARAAGYSPGRITQLKGEQ